MQKLNQEIPKQTTEEAKMSDVNCQIIVLARFHWRKHEQTHFRIITSCIRKRYHQNPLAETFVSLRKHTEKWSGSVVSAATETWINDMYPLPETHVSRCVSATLSCVSATFQSADSWHFVLCENEGTERDVEGVGWNMSIPVRLFLVLDENDWTISFLRHSRN